MRYFWILLLVGAVQAGEPPVKEESYESYWTNIMRGLGVHSDTIKMFIEAPECFPFNDSLGIFKAKGMRRYISDDGERGYLLFIRSKSKIETERNHIEPIRYEFEIESVKIFDLTKKK